MNFNILGAFAGLVIMWILCALFSKGPHTKMEFLRGDYDAKSVSNFWFVVLLFIGAIVGGFVPGL